MPVTTITYRYHLAYVGFSGARCVQVKEDRHTLSAAKTYSRVSVDIGDVQIAG